MHIYMCACVRVAPRHFACVCVCVCVSNSLSNFPSCAGALTQMLATLSLSLSLCRAWERGVLGAENKGTQRNTKEHLTYAANKVR